MNIVILDYRVHVHNIVHKLKTFDPSISGVSTDTWVSLAWEIILNKPIPRFFSQDTKVIIVDDYPEYWRANQCLLDGLPEYKQGRPVKSQLFWEVYNIGLSKNFPVIRSRGFEADDMAGEVYRQLVSEKPNNVVWFWTVDSDWLQLIDNKVNTRFYSTLPHWGKLNNENDVKLFFKKRGVKIEHPRDIVNIKSKEGDKADNLPPGCPKYFIDLVEPMYKPPEKVSEQIRKEIITNSEPNINYTRYLRAVRYLHHKGLPYSIVF